MKPHKWAKEIKAWADGAEIEFKEPEQKDWMNSRNYGNGIPQWYECWEYRIKPQPKEPQYLYVYQDIGKLTFERQDTIVDNMKYIGKIKLEQE